MQTHPLSLTHLIREPTITPIHLVREPAQATSSRPPLLLLLHGVGSHESDLMSLAPYLDGRFLVISARAPLTLGPGAFGWYRVQFTPDGPTNDPAESARGWQAAADFIGEAVAAYDLDPSRVYLMGFSQGAIMSLSVALTQPEVVAGAVIMSGRLLPEAAAQAAPPERLAGKPFLVVHGTYDTVLPIAMGREIRDTLARLPVALTYREYPMGHQISQESLSDITAWLRERLDSR